MMGFDGNTRVVTVYQKIMTVEQIAKEPEVFVYSWNPVTKLPGVDFIKVELIGEVSSLMLVKFDSGLEVRCSPDTVFIAFRGEPVMASDLQADQSIRAFSTSIHRDGHLRIHGWNEGKAKHQYVARVIWEYFNGEIPEGYVIHHKDQDELNNDVDNLQAVTVREHNRIHFRNRSTRGFYGRNHKVMSTELIGPGKIFKISGNQNGTFTIADPIPISGNSSGVVAGCYVDEG